MWHSSGHTKISPGDPFHERKFERILRPNRGESSFLGEIACIQSGSGTLDALLHLLRPKAMATQLPYRRCTRSTNGHKNSGMDCRKPRVAMTSSLRYNPFTVLIAFCEQMPPPSTGSHRSLPSSTRSIRTTPLGSPGRLHTEDNLFGTSPISPQISDRFPSRLKYAAAIVQAVYSIG